MNESGDFFFCFLFLELVFFFVSLDLLSGKKCHWKHLIIVCCEHGMSMADITATGHSGVAFQKQHT